MKLIVLILALLSAIGAAFVSPLSPSSSMRADSVTRMAIMDDADTAVQGMSRRCLFGSVAASSLWHLGSQVASADTLKLDVFEDKDLGFKLSVPSSWEKSEQSLQDRRKITLFVDPTSDKKTLLFLAYTPVRDDFTQLSSFGSVDQVAQTTILPKGELAGTENSSQMISAESKKNAYFFDYIATVPGQPQAHYRTIFTMGQVSGSAGAMLVTITAQCTQASYKELKATFDKIMESYGKAD